MLARFRPTDGRSRPPPSLRWRRSSPGSPPASSPFDAHAHRASPWADDGALSDAEDAAPTGEACFPPRPLPARPVDAHTGSASPRPVKRAARRGWSGRCPACGEASLFHSWMVVHDQCPPCGAALAHPRICDAVPAVAVPLAFVAAAVLGGVLELLGSVPLVLEIAASEAVAVTTALQVLPRAKGLLVGLSWAHRVGGFDPRETDAGDGPLPEVR